MALWSSCGALDEPTPHAAKTSDGVTFSFSSALALQNAKGEKNHNHAVALKHYADTESANDE